MPDRFVKPYLVGEMLRLSATFSDDGCSPTMLDPDAVTLRVKDGAGATSVYVYTTDAIVRDSQGEYHFDLDLTDAVDGTWFYRWEGTGAAQAAAEASFKVVSGNFAGSP